MAVDMMETIRMWNTPFIGAYHLWRFASGYASASNGRAAPLMLFFIVSALVSDKEYWTPTARRTLQTYNRYFVEKKRLSLLRVLPLTIASRREYTCAAIERAVMGRFLEWNAEECTLAPRRIKPERMAAHLDEDTVKAGKAAERIGEWFAGATISDICVLLGVKLS